MVAESRDTTLRIAIVQLFITIHRQIGLAEFDRLIRPQFSEKDAQLFDERLRKALPATASSASAGGLSQTSASGAQQGAAGGPSSNTAPPGSFSTFVKRPSTAGPAPQAPVQTQVAANQQQHRPQTQGGLGRPSYVMPPKGELQQPQQVPAEQPVVGGIQLQFPEDDLEGMRSAADLMPLEPIALTDEITVARVERPEVLESLGYAPSALSSAEDSELGVPPPAQLNVILAAIASHDANEATTALLSLDELLRDDGKPGMSFYKFSIGSCCPDGR